LKKTVAIIAGLSILMPYVTTLGILIDFSVNQDFIAKVLCIEKDEPMSNCNGKCYLSQKLKKVQEPDDTQAPTRQKSEKVEVIYYFTKCKYQGLTSSDKFLQKNNNFYYNPQYRYEYAFDVFHPPQSYLI